MKARWVSHFELLQASVSAPLQTVAVTLGLAVLVALVYGPNVIHGGFLSDAWSVRASYVFAPGDGFFDKLDPFLAQPGIDVRPLFAIYLVLLNTAFGDHMAHWLVVVCATSVLMSSGLYLLLRRLDFAFLHAALIAGLVLIFPAASSLRLWTATASISVAICMTAFGLILALEAFATTGRMRALLHLASLVAFVTSMLFYEAAVPLMLASILLYRLHVPWRVAAKRWGLDVSVLISFAGVLAISSPAAKETQDLAGLLSHGAEIFDQTWMLLGTVVFPFGSAHWYVLGLLALVPLAAGIVHRRLPAADPVRAELRFWLGALLAGTVVVVLGYSVFVPGIDYYAPMGLGIANRVNAVPGIGWVIALYSWLALSATLAFRGLPAFRQLSSSFVATASILLAIGWLGSISRDVDAFIAAFREDERVLATIRAALPEPPPESTIWTFGQPVEIAPGVPVFGNTWDMTSSVQLMYHDPSIRSYVGFPDTTFECRPDSVVPGGNGNYQVALPPEAVSPFASSYGNTYFVDTTSGRLERIRTPAQCRAAARSFRRSPSYPGEPPPPTPATSSPADTYRLARDGTVLIDAQEQRFPIQRDAIIGFVDNVTRSARRST